jgi:hypothetical protein
VIRDIARDAWRESPSRFLLAIAVTPVVVLVIRALLVVAIVGFGS